MRFVPAVFKLLHNLPWKGGGLTPVAYQRLTLRNYLATLWLSLLLSVGLGIYMLSSALITNPLAVMAVNVLLIAVGALLILWLWYVSAKIEVLRWRGLGLVTSAIVVLLSVYVVLDGLGMAADYLADNPLLVLTGMVPVWLLPLLPFIKLITLLEALYSYYTYFEEQPIGKTVIPAIEPVTTPLLRFEKAGLFILQTWVWFGVLSTPLHLLFTY